MPDVSDYDDQTSWMHDCVSEMMDEGREQDQAVAACLNIWRNRAAEGPRKQETQAEFIARCRENMMGADMSDDQATAVCLRIWRDDNTLPQTDESQSDFNDRCVPAVMSDGAPQDQAVAICLQRWRDAENVSASYRRAKQVNVEEIDVPRPADGETRIDFTERCVQHIMRQDVEEGQAYSWCALAWENRSASRMRQKTHAEPVSGMEFVLSDETPDRMGDVI
jgi:hypothetical protein